MKMLLKSCRLIIRGGEGIPNPWCVVSTICVFVSLLINCSFVGVEKSAAPPCF